MAKQSTLFIKINGDTRSTVFNTDKLFADHDEDKFSPIDIYIRKNKSFLIKLGDIERAKILDISNPDDRDIYNLFLLGFVSNVESYFRRIIRRTILIDNIALKNCLEQQLTYAAAIHHNSNLLPEALLENCSFISQDNIKKTVNSFLGIAINTSEKVSGSQKDLSNCLEMFDQLCHLRHCIVHRAGLLGSKNAIKLGIDSHKNFFEKPIALDVSFLQIASSVCLNCIKAFNSFAFNELVNRYIKENSEISWNYTKDKKWFNRYFNLFNSEELNNEAKKAGFDTYDVKKAYNAFKDHYK